MAGIDGARGASGNGTRASVAVRMCGACEQELATDARFCPYCGAAQAEAIGAVEAPDDAADALIGTAMIDLDPTDVVPATAMTADAHDVTAAPSARRSRRRLIVGVVSVVVLAVAGLVVATRDSGPTYDLDAALTRTGEQVTAVWADAARAGTLDQLQAVGSDAETTIGKLETRRAEFEAVGNDDDRRAAVAAIDGHIGSLAALAALEGLDAAKVAEWPSAGTEVTATLDDVRAGEAALVDRDLPVMPGIADDIEAAAGKLDVAMTGMRDKLAAWADEVARINTDRDAQLAALNGYADQFRPQLESYAGLRVSLGDFTDRVQNEGGTYTEIYSFLGGAVARRQEVLGSMSSTSPTAAMVPAHTAITSAVKDSITAVEAAIAGIEQFQYDYYYTVESTPGWQTFSRMSGQISDAYTAAVSNWDKALADEQARIQAIKTPSRPAV